MKKIEFYLYKKCSNNATEENTQTQNEETFEEERDYEEFDLWVNDNYNASDFLQYLPKDILKDLKKDFKINLKSNNVERTIRNHKKKIREV